MMVKPLCIIAKILSGYEPRENNLTDLTELRCKKLLFSFPKSNIGLLHFKFVHRFKMVFVRHDSQKVLEVVVI